MQDDSANIPIKSIHMNDRIANPYKIRVLLPEAYDKANSFFHLTYVFSKNSESVTQQKENFLTKK